MAEDLYQRKDVGAHRQGPMRWLRLRLLAVAFCFVAATAFSALMQIGVSVESRWAHAASGLVIEAAQAGKRLHRRKREDWRDDWRDDNDRQEQPQTKADNQEQPQTRADRQEQPQTKADNQGQSQTKADGEGQPQNKNADNKVDGDDRSTGSARNAESTPDRTSRNPGSVRQAQSAEPPKTSAEPPKTVVEAAKRLFKWMQPAPQAIPPWPEAKVTRAPREDTDALPPPGKLAQKTQAPAREETGKSPPQGKLAQKLQPAKRPASRSGPGDILAGPGTHRPNELLVLNPSTAVLGVLRARGWREDRGAARGVVRLFSESENALAAREKLESQFQGTHFGLNFVYYHVESDGVTRRSSDAVARVGSCDPQRCYAPALIDWRADLAACAAGVKIGIIDTAVDEAHPALAWKKLKVLRAPDQKPADMEPHWHGTGVVSLLTGHPKSSTPGLVPDADYVITDAFFTNTLGQRETDTYRLLWALNELEQRGAQVVNMSLSGPRDELVRQRLVELSKKGMVFVAAAGNGGDKAPPAYPAAYKDEVIAVTAVDRNQLTYKHANQGDYIDVAAPGVRVWTALPNNKEGAQSGTSFAAPFVTAIVAAIYKKALLPAMNRAHETRTPEAVTLAHLLTEKVVRDSTVGLVRAPANCAGERRQVPTARLAPAIELSRWLTRVEFVSSGPRN